ncbi:unnamed protein product [Sphagnum jensenii]|uniref:DUF4200 domain-containing protein n=1 Tax=Sphagnum jensenii TaxID=128206 RepID=A0ABP1C092_9BRYO
MATIVVPQVATLASSIVGGGTTTTTTITSTGIVGELETTLPIVDIHVGPGQLDKALPATRLLEKRRLMYLVHDELERQKVECALKEEVLQKREDALRDRDLHLQESLIGFSKFLQENAIKKKRAEKKSVDEIHMRMEKEVEIEHLETNLEKLKDLRGITLAHLDRLMLYQKYLESVVEATPAYHEINDLLLRHATLAASHLDLKKHVEVYGDQIEILRTELQKYTKSTMNEILTLHNDVSVTKQAFEKKKMETEELQLQIDSVLHLAAAKTLARSQICMAAENLFHRIDKVSIISRPPYDNPLKQLDSIGDYVTDLNYIQKAFKATLTKKEPLLPKD